MEDRPEFVGTIGEKLQEARRKKGKTLKEVESFLRIRASYLEALEKDEFEKIPGYAYAKAFLKSYANYLGLNAEDLLNELEKVYKKEPQPSFSSQKEAIPTFKSKRWIWLSLSIAFLILALIIFRPFSTKKRPTTKEEINLEKEVPQVPTLETTPAQKITTGKAPSGEEITGTFPTTFTPIASEGLKLSVRIVGERCWLRVLADGEKAFEGILVNGESKEWEATETITLRAGNPKAVEIKVNGKTVQVPSVGGVFEKTFRREEQ